MSLFIAFAIFIFLAFVIDLGIFSKKDRTPTLKESLTWTIIWTLLAIAFKFIVDTKLGTQAGSEFLTVYILERILSMDNIFIFVLIFSYFKVPSQLQQRALVIGILLAIFLRGAFIYAGISIVNSFSWVLYFFGVFLIYTGIKIIITKEEDQSLESNPVVKFCKKHFAVVSEYHGHKSFVKINGKTAITMFGLTIITITASDLIFAIDSIPATFAITQNLFVVFTANVFSLLGIRNIFFVISDIINRFHYLKHALSIILVFIGIKMLIAEIYHIETSHSLIFIASVFILAILGSLLKGKHAHQS